MIEDLRKYCCIAVFLLLFLSSTTADETKQVHSSSFHPHSSAADQKESIIDNNNKQYVQLKETIANIRDSSQHYKHQSYDVDEFYSFPLDDNSLMAALFPSMNRLQDAWEVHPLLSKVSFNNQLQPLKTVPLNSIPTIFHNRTYDPLMSLFSVSDTLKVLSHSHMTHSIDYKLVKKITNANGEEGMGILPNRKYTTDEITYLFHHQQGMSLVVYDMQKRWYPIAQMVRQMEEELGPKLMNSNLYMTPQVSHNSGDSGSRQGVMAHWDTTDVIIIQLAGRKRWMVAREPIIYLPSQGNFHNKLKKNEVEYYARDNHFLEFTLCPGDVLYIPRGHIHNASTVDFGNIKRKWVDWDTCPDYPSDMAEALDIEGPSMHLTLSLSSDSSIETLLHFALHSFFAIFPHKNDVVLPARSCRYAQQAQSSQEIMSNAVSLETVLHHALVEVAQRLNDCDNPSYRGIAVKNRGECGATLRKSVPMLLLEYNELIDPRSLNAKKQDNLRVMQKTYSKTLDIFASSVSIPATVDFIQSNLISKNKYTDFSYPYFKNGEDEILCPEELLEVSETETILADVLKDFVEFAEMNFLETLKSMNLDGKQTRDMRQQSQKLDLERVGQTLHQ